MACVTNRGRMAFVAPAQNKLESAFRVMRELVTVATVWVSDVF